MPPPLDNFVPIFWIELVYSLVVIISCIIIFFKTNELYQISLHKGIKYFRNAFLFFGIAFFSRLFLRLVAIVNGPDRMDRVLFSLGFLIFLYAGLMAGFFLIYSSLWKRIRNSDEFGWIFHPLALSLAAILIIFLFRSETFLILTLIFLTAAILAYSNDKNTKNKTGINNVHIIYILLFISWIVSALAQFIILISDETSIILYSFSSLLFLIILYRVIKSICK